ncbi:MAG: ATP-binding cassette domain-containing protein [Bacteroidales bacterium]|nr:ATP-binding cassette domain-containing protein [Bacteroidales bacterium]
MAQPVIRFEQVGKLYRLGTVGTGTLSHDLRRWWITSVRGKEDPYLKIGETNDRSKKGTSDYVYALKDINFEVQQGDVLGIIGKNGAGKSTLLKLLSRVTYPTTGKIYTRGRIASLLEVGTGFHPELTGRENIYMNGSILGMKKWEIDRSLDEIVDFSGCERYLDTPVKRYSSGMTVRLGFAIAAHLNPEILVVDEVLAVGDAEFQKKAIGKMQDVSQGQGRTVLFVSHNMNSVRSLCKSAIALDNGVVMYNAPVNDAVDYYTRTLCKSTSQPTNIRETIDKRQLQYNLDVYFWDITLHDHTQTYASDEDIILAITLKGNKTKKDCRISCTISSNHTNIATSSSSALFDIESGEVKTILYRISNHRLAYGAYEISFSVGHGNMLTGETNYDIVLHAISFDIDRPHITSDQHFAMWHYGWGFTMFETSILNA